MRPDFSCGDCQQGESLGLPHSRPLPDVGARCHEGRVPDREHAWRIIYHIADDAVVVLDVFSKKSRTTPNTVLAACRERLAAYLTAVRATKEQR